MNGKARTAELGLMFQVFGQFSEGKSTGVALGGALWNRILAEIKAFGQLFRDWKEAEEGSSEAVRMSSSE